MARPIGITVLGVLILLSSVALGLIGLAGVLVGLAGFLPGVGLNATALLLGGVLYLLIATVLGVSGVGLLRLRPWAWWLALLATLFAIAYSGVQVYSDPADVRLGTLITLAVGGVVFADLLTSYRSFHRPAVAM